MYTLSKKFNNNRLFLEDGRSSLDLANCSENDQQLKEYIISIMKYLCQTTESDVTTKPNSPYDNDLNNLRKDLEEEDLLFKTEVQKVKNEVMVDSQMILEKSKSLLNEELYREQEKEKQLEEEMNRYKNKLQNLHTLKKEIGDQMMRDGNEKAIRNQELDILNKTNENNKNQQPPKSKEEKEIQLVITRYGSHFEQFQSSINEYLQLLNDYELLLNDYVNRLQQNGDLSSLLQLKQNLERLTTH